MYKQVVASAQRNPFSHTHTQDDQHSFIKKTGNPSNTMVLPSILYVARQERINGSGSPLIRHTTATCVWSVTLIPTTGSYSFPLDLKAASETSQSTGAFFFPPLFLPNTST